MKVAWLTSSSVLLVMYCHTSPPGAHRFATQRAKLLWGFCGRAKLCGLAFGAAQPSFVVRTGVGRMIRFLVLRILSMKFRSAFVGRDVGIAGVLCRL